MKKRERAENLRVEKYRIAKIEMDEEVKRSQ